MKKNTFKFFVSKAKAKVKIKPYVKKIFPGKNPQMSFPGVDPNKFYFDINATVPAGTAKKVYKHVKKYKTPYEVVASGTAGFAGAKLAQRKKQRRKK